MLDVLDKLGSVFSAAFALAGLVLTGYGLRRDRRRAAPQAPPVPPPPVEGSGPGLVVPDRTEWVPDPSHLPEPSGPHHGGYGTPTPLPATPGRRGPLPLGVALLVVGIVLGVVTALL
ncbi:hypothetical protein [Saccharopolyspora sp. CA-218241]|uniref:hypothetical protein n=1 Tax=Saccharopolyspora sp. CA-218241 TaxID=3240027 RepID=UPI003D95A964